MAASSTKAQPDLSAWDVQVNKASTAGLWERPGRRRFETLFSLLELVEKKGFTMLRWAVLFLIIALIASAFGFFGLAGTAETAAKICAVVFIILAILSFIGGGMRTPHV